MPRLKVLLLSPVRTLDPPNGDVTYTEELVATPPEGVDYTTYDEALADGTLREFHRSGASGGTVSLTRERVVNRLRRYRMLHREVYRYMAVKPGAYDLVHTHVFSVGWRGEPPPVLLSNAAPVDLLYRDVLGWPASRLAWARTADETLARLHGVQHTTYPLPGSPPIACFSETLRDWYATHRPRYTVPTGFAPNFVTCPHSRTAPGPAGVRIGLIAAEPTSKGVDVFLDAVQRLRRDGFDGEFIVVGRRTERLAALAETLEVAWLERMPRQQLLDAFLPTLTALAYPSRFDGAPFVLLEALARGIPALVSNYFALPEMVGEHGNAGLVSPVGDVDALAEQMLAVALDSKLRARLSENAVARHRSVYSPESALPRLAEMYHALV